MAIIIRAKKNDTTGDVIKKFKKAVAATDIVQIARDRAFFQKPSQIKAVKNHAKVRARRKFRSLKKRKNTTSGQMSRLLELMQ